MSCKFESLESRQMMSATAGDLVDELCPASQPAPVVMAMKSDATPRMMAAKAPAPSYNVQKMVGKYKKGTSLFFSSVMHIKSVSADGNIVGKVNIPWLATCSIRGTIDKSTGRFTIRFAEMSEKESSRMNGYFKGKMHPSGKYLTGTFKYYYGKDSTTGVKPYQAKYVRQ